MTRSPFRIIHQGTLVIALLLAGNALATPGTLIRASDLLAEAYTDAKSLASLPAEAKLTVLEGKGGWSKVRTEDGKTGWVRLLNVRMSAPAGSGGNTLTAIGNVVRTGTTKSAATTGAKGLSREQLALAQPNPREVAKLNAFRAKPSDINQFAAARKLSARDIPELPN